MANLKIEKHAPLRGQCSKVFEDPTDLFENDAKVGLAIMSFGREFHLGIVRSKKAQPFELISTS